MRLAASNDVSNSMALAFICIVVGEVDWLLLPEIVWRSQQTSHHLSGYCTPCSPLDRLEC